MISIVHTGIGTAMAFPGITLPQLTNPNSSDVYLTQTEAALFSK